LLVDGDDQITHLVLERGHLWGRREVTVPIGAVAHVATDSVEVSLTKDEVGALPAIPVHRWLVQKGGASPADVATTTKEGRA
jgi:hypothetical protein